MTRLRHPRLLAAAGVVALLAIAAATGAAAAEPDSRVQVSSTAPSSSPRSAQVLAASASWVLYALDGKVYAMPSGGGHQVALNTDTGSTISIAGGMVQYFVEGDGYRYRDLDTGVTGEEPRTFAAASPDGGVYGAYDATDGAVHGYDQNVTTGAVTDLGELPGFAKDDYVSALADENGAVFGYTSGGPLYYVGFDAPGTVVTLQTNGLGLDSCTSLVGDALGCVGGHTVDRVPVDGSAPATTAIDVPASSKTGGRVIDTVVLLTESRTAWIFDLEAGDDYKTHDVPTRLHSVPAGSPNARPETSSFTVESSQDLTSGGASFYLRRSGSVTTAGIYSLSSAGANAKKFHLAGAEPLFANAAAVTTGQALFFDDSRSGGGNIELRARPITRSGDTITTGPIHDITLADFRGPVMASDSRVLYVATHARSANPTIGISATTGSGTAHTGYSRYEALPIAISGTRAVLRSQTRGKHVLLLNLVTRHLTDLTTQHGAQGSAVALFGRYAYFGTKDGSIRRLDLGTNKVEQIAGPTKASRGKLPTDIAAWGDYVAWDYFVSRDIRQNPPRDTFSSYLRNARTMSPAVALPTGDSVEGASVNGIALHARSAQTPATLLRPYTSDATSTIRPNHAFLDSTIAFFTTRPTGGTAYAKPLAHVTNPPRSLGNPFGAMKIAHSGHWSFDLPTSAVLTSCHITLRNASGKTVRTLPCAANLMAVGEAQVSWDGTSTSGKAASNGLYRYTVSASNADGALLASDGSTSATRGTVTVGSSNAGTSSSSNTPLAATGFSTRPWTLTGVLLLLAGGLLLLAGRRDHRTQHGSAG